MTMVITNHPCLKMSYNPLSQMSQINKSHKITKTSFVRNKTKQIFKFISISRLLYARCLIPPLEFLCGNNVSFPFYLMNALCSEQIFSAYMYAVLLCSNLRHKGLLSLLAYQIQRTTKFIIFIITFTIIYGLNTTPKPNCWHSRDQHLRHTSMA